MTNSSCPPTAVEKAKIRELCRKVFTAASSRGTPNLLELGLGAETLTPEVLLAEMDRPGYIGRMSLLQFLTDNRYLSQIPAQCLPPAVTLKNRFYPTPHNESFFSNFVDYCAGQGHYGHLPEDYQTRDYLLGKVRAESEWALCPLKRAAILGHLPTLPLHTLQPTDVCDLVVQQAFIFQQIEPIAHLLRPENISPHSLIYYGFSKGYLPPAILARLSSKVMMATAEGGCALSHAIRWGAVESVPTTIFMHDLKAATDAVEDGIARIKSNREISKEEANRRIGVARTWLIKVAQDILRGDGGKAKPNSGT